MRNTPGLWVLSLLISGAACTSGESVSTTLGPASTTASTSGLPSTTAAPASTTTTARDMSTFEWMRVPLDVGGDAQQWMTGVAVLEDRVIAVGMDLSGGDGDAAVWTSADGVTWSRVAHDETVFGGDGRQSMYGVAAFDGGVVAVGDDWSSSGEHVGAVWVSPDGVSWSRIRDEFAFGETDGQIIYGVAGHDGGVVAVGIDFSDAEGIAAPAEGETGDAAVWVSADGYFWTRVVPGQFGLEATQVLRGVAAGDSGLVAVGFSHEVGDVDAAVWISSDGYAWTRIAQEALRDPEPQSMNGVTPFGLGFAAVGSSGGDAAVWTSPDGASWTKVPHDPAVFGGNHQAELRIQSVVALAEGLVAVGHVQNNDLEDAAVWISLDGLTWTRMLDEALLGGPGQQMIEAIVGFDGGLVAVGRDGTGSNVSPGVWIARPPDA